MKKELNILLVEDNEGDVRIIRELLKEQSLLTFNISLAGSLNEAVKELTANTYETILLDLGLPDSMGYDTFSKLISLYPKLIAIIILTGLNDTELGLNAVNHGAQDFIVKGHFDSEKIVKSIIYSYERNRLRSELEVQLEARHQAEENARRLNRLLMVLSNVNQTIVRVNDKRKLIDEVCVNLVKTGDIFHVTAIFPKNPELNNQCCFDELNDCKNNLISEYFRDFHVSVVKTRKPVLIDNFNEKISKTDLTQEFKNKAKSCAIFPMLNNEEVYGTISIISETDNFFDDEEIKLMVEITEDISFAFTNIDKAKEKKIADQELEFSKKAAESLYSLSQKTDKSEQDLIKIALEMAVEITDSKIGYLHFMNEDQNTLDLIAWSEETLKVCIAAKETHYPLSSAGIWADPARTGKPVIHNDYPDFQKNRGLPEGHAPLYRHMSVPVSDSKKIVVIAGVGNKEDPYTESDSRHMLILMNEMWKIITRNRLIGELDKSREKLNLIAKRTSAVMYQLGSDGYKFDYIHEAIETLTGYNAEEINDIGFENLIQRIEMIGGEVVDYSLFKAVWEEKKKKEITIEYLIETKNGDLKWLNDKSYPLSNDSGEAVGSIGILMDISSQKEVEIELVSQKKRSEQLFSNSPVAIVQLNSEGSILNVNSSFENIFGFTKTDVIGENLDLLIVPEELKYEALNFYTETSNGLATSDISIRKRKNGSIIHVSIAGVPINIHGENAGFYVMFTDITKQKMAEEALIKSRDKAEESDRLKTAFMHNISHEIRTPMNAIVGFSALLSEPRLEEETRSSFVDTIVQSSNHLLTIINDIVEISNIEANLVRISKNNVDLNQVIKTISDIFQLKAREKNKPVKLFNEVPEISARIVTDNTKLYQILSNLVNNALKFTASGKIEIGYSKVENFIEFFVADTGIGIAEEFQTRIFDRFYQVEYSDNRQFEGTGLGLSICKAYVELLGGTIWVHSEKEKGSRFSFRLPCKDILSLVEQDRTTTPVEFSIKGRKKILVAEDIESNFKLIKYYLSSSDVEIIMALNGKEAVDYFRSNPDVALILMDIKMPVMDGYTATKLIRETNNTIPIIAQTAYADDRIRAEECGCNGFISKPFQKQELLSTIAGYLKL